MKRFFIIILLIGCLTTLSAQNAALHHRYGIAADAGWSHLFLGQTLNTKTNLATPSWGWFGGGSLVYELEYKHLLGRLALETDFSSNWNLFDAPSQYRRIEEYATMKYHYDFSNFKQRTSYANLYLPIMVGAEFKSLYFLVGTKLGVCPYSAKTLSFVDAHIWGSDEDVIDPMEGLYTHDMGDYSFAGEKQKLSLNAFSATASFEVGLCLKKAQEMSQYASNAEKYKELHRQKSFAECTHYKVALFADYGLTDMYSYQPNGIVNQTSSGINNEGGLIDIPQTNTAVPYSMYGYESNRDAVLHNLFVGLRFAVMYQPPQQPPTSGNMANPHMIIFVSDGITGEPLKGAEVQMCGTNPRNNRPQIVTKSTGGKFKNVDRSCPSGKYDISITYPGYLPFDTVGYEHGEEFDTLNVLLYPPHDLTVNVIDALTGESINAKVVIHDENGNKVNTLKLDSGMVDTMTLSSGLKYQFCATSKGYFDTCYIITRENNALTIALTRIPPVKFVLKAMYFATDSTVVLPISEKPLTDLYNFLSQNPEVTIRIIGHTDDVASDEYNQDLSERRAASVKAEMVKRGIDPERIETLGKGESEPIVPNESDGNRQMNRRVEIEVLSGYVRLEVLREFF